MTPQQQALSIIRSEHRTLAAVIHALEHVAADMAAGKLTPDYKLLWSIIYYIDEFPERLHHRKETDLLFPLIRARSDSAGEILEKLDRDHGVGERAIRDLEHTLLSWEMLGDSRRDGFEQAVERYLSFYLKHMQLEEEVVLPLAQQVLEPADWAVLDDAFSENRDPLTGHPPSAEYEQLFSRIVRTAPAPIGLGGAA